MADVFAIATRVSALCDVRRKVENDRLDRAATIDKLLARPHKRFAKPYAYHVKVLAKLTDEISALDWAIEQARKGA